MKLPNCAQAVVTIEKVRAYLLNEQHPQNKGKAAFYQQVGFTRIDFAVLRNELLILACSGKVRETVPAKEGIKYVVIGFIVAPNGKRYPLKSIWMIEFDNPTPRLVSAYPNH